MTVALPQTIGVAVDGSDQSLRAMSYAVKLAGQNNSKIVCMHFILLPSHVSPDTLSKLRNELSEKARAILSQAKRVGEAANVKIETRTVETTTSVVMAIVDLAEKEKVDLMVLGTKGT